MADRDIEINRLRAKANNQHKEAIRTMAVVLAIEEGEMSPNEGKRWLDKDDKERLKSPLQPDWHYYDFAEDELDSMVEEWAGDPDRDLTEMT